MRVLGVDPGASGALALLFEDQLLVVDMPTHSVKRGKGEKREVDGYALRHLLEELRPDVAYLEQVGGITGQSASAAFNFGRASGVVEGALKMAGVRVEMTAPHVWKRRMGLKGGKDASRARSSALFPAYAHNWKRVKDDGRAEAVLIAEYGRQQLGITQAGVFS